MCDIPSTLRSGDKTWFANDKDIKKYMRKHGGIFADYCGHSGLRKLYPEIPEDAVSAEGVDSKTPAWVIAAIERGDCNEMLMMGGITVKSGTVTLPEAVKEIMGEVEAWGGTVNAPALEKVTGTVEAWGGTVNAPKLETALVVRGYHSGTVNVPKLKTARTVAAYDGGTINALVLETAETVGAWDGGTINAPLLERRK